MSSLPGPLTPPHGLGRRGFLTAMGGGLAALAVAGCANEELDKPAAGAKKSTAPEATSFPVTVTHKFGETTIPQEPKRILALGQTDCDPLIALGITPIAVGSFVEDWYNPVHPWNENGFEGVKPKELNFQEFEFEKIAALSPHLITMVSGGITKKDYATLSKIAPVVGPPAGYEDSAVPLRPHTELVAKTVGREKEAKEILDNVEKAYADARKAHTEWGSMNAVHAEASNKTYTVLGKNAPRTEFLTSLGFTLSPKLDKITGTDYSAEISAEQLDLVGDLDLVVWCTDPGEVTNLQKDPVVSRLASSTEGHTIWTSYDKTDEFMWAMDWNTVLSAQYALELGVPLVTAALAGQSPVSEGA